MPGLIQNKIGREMERNIGEKIKGSVDGKDGTKRNVERESRKLRKGSSNILFPFLFSAFFSVLQKFPIAVFVLSNSLLYFLEKVFNYLTALLKL